MKRVTCICCEKDFIEGKGDSPNFHFCSTNCFTEYGEYFLPNLSAN